MSSPADHAATRRELAPVETLGDGDLDFIIQRARLLRNALDWTPREKDAWRELERRGLVKP